VPNRFHSDPPSPLCRLCACVRFPENLCTILHNQAPIPPKPPGNRPTCHLPASPKAVRFTSHDFPRTEITKNRQTCHQVEVPSSQRCLHSCSFVFIRGRIDLFTPSHPSPTQPCPFLSAFTCVQRRPERFLHAFSPRRRPAMGSFRQTPRPPNGNPKNEETCHPAPLSFFIRVHACSIVANSFTPSHSKRPDFAQSCTTPPNEFVFSIRRLARTAPSYPSVPVTPRHRCSASVRVHLRPTPSPSAFSNAASVKVR
jgi:hypothetical protein